MVDLRRNIQEIRKYKKGRIRRTNRKLPTTLSSPPLHQPLPHCCRGVHARTLNVKALYIDTRPAASSGAAFVTPTTLPVQHTTLNPIPPTTN